MCVCIERYLVCNPCMVQLYTSQRLQSSLKGPSIPRAHYLEISTGLPKFFLPCNTVSTAQRTALFRQSTMRTQYSCRGPSRTVVGLGGAPSQQGDRCATLQAGNFCARCGVQVPTSACGPSLHAMPCHVMPCCACTGMTEGSRNSRVHGVHHLEQVP